MPGMPFQASSFVIARVAPDLNAVASCGLTEGRILLKSHWRARWLYLADSSQNS
jgi:hypothetical protein